MPSGRVLMIAHHFPPMGGSGSNRALAFAHYLPEYGWEPLVLTPGKEWADPRDDELLSEVPPQLRVIRTRSFEQRPKMSQPTLTPALSQRERGSALRSHVGHLKRFPDAHLGWLPYALAAARNHKYDVAYSSSGPFTSHLIGLLLKRLTRRPWVAELRDGWYRWNRAIFPDYPRWRDLLEQRLEAAALHAVDRVVLVTDRMADAFRCQYPDLPTEHFAVVPNGFDKAQFAGLPEATQPGAAFDVLHSGALYYGRSITAFLDAAQSLVDTDTAFKAAFSLTLVGTLDATARADLRRHSLGGRIRFSGQVSHVESLAAMRSASLLLLIANTTHGAEATVPGKLFEYLAVGRPVLAIAPTDSSTADVLNQTGGGWLADSADRAAIACALERAFRAHQVGTPNPPDQAQVAHFDRRAQAGDLSRIFDQVVAGAARRA